MSLKKASASDHAEIEKLFLSIAAAHPNPAEFSWGADQIADEIRLSQFYILKSSQVVVGFISYREMANIIEINALGTHPEYRRKGIMHTLLKAFLDYCRAMSKEVHLEVHAGNLSARALYDQLGFKLLRKRQNYYKDGGEALVLAITI